MAKSAHYKCALEGASSDLFGEYLYSLVDMNVRKLTKKFNSVVSEQDKEDIVQDIWLMMQKKKHMVKEDNNFKGWVYMCCRNYIYSFLRERKKKNEREFPTDHLWGIHDTHSPEKDYISREVEKRLHEAIRKQTTEQQKVAEMLIDDVPYSKMAHKLDCTENTVRGRIFRLRHNLKVAN